MKKYGLIILSAILALSVTVSVCAAPLDKFYIDDDKVTLTLKGTMEGASKGEAVFIQLLDAGKSIDEKAEYTAEKIMSDFVIYRQMSLDANGGYEITANMKGRAMGEYLLRINGKDVTKIFYTSVELKEDALFGVEEACLEYDREEGVALLKAMIDTENPVESLKMYFGSALQYKDSVDSTLLAQVIYDWVNVDDTVINSPQKFTEFFEVAVNVAALNEGLGDITELKEECSLKDGYVEIYTKEFDDTMRSGFATKYFKGKNITTAKDIEAKFNESVVLAYANAFDSWSDAEILIKVAGDDIGVDMKDYNKLSTKKKSELHQIVSKYKNITSTSSLADKINDDTEELLSESEKSSGGGSGGGGGGFSNTASTAPIITEGLGMAETAFTDMAGYEWAENAVNSLSEDGTVSGVGEGLFAPGRNITREEMLTMLLRAYGVDVTSATTDKFTDVDLAAWYAPYVAKGLELGVTEGISDTEFGTGRYITRQETAAMANRIAQKFGKSFTSDGTVFTDDADISDWAKSAVYALKGAGVINGTGEGSFNPVANCTRAEAAQIIYSLISK